jgi:hypothetical protein
MRREADGLGLGSVEADELGIVEEKDMMPSFAVTADELGQPGLRLLVHRPHPLRSSGRRRWGEARGNGGKEGLGGGAGADEELWGCGDGELRG